MKTAIIVSQKDPAGINIKNNLIKYFEKSDEKYDGEFVYARADTKLYTTKKESIHLEGIDKKIKADLIIFATKHKSEAGRKSFSLHCPGNWDRAEAGGREKKLCVAPACIMKEAFIILDKNGAGKGHEVTLEVTHHGPLIETPCFFIEIGSSKEEWEKKENGEIIAKTIVELLDKIEKRKIGKYKIVFGIGGPHYANTFNKYMFGKDIALGHICPKYMLEKLDKEMIMHALDRTLEKVDFFLLDWKGLGKEKARIKAIIEEIDVEYCRTDKIKS